MPIISSVGNFINAANEKADQLTAGLKAALCLPSLLSSIPGTFNSLISGVVGGVATAITNVGETVSDIVTNTVNGAVAEITGAVTGLISSVTDTLGQIGGAIEQLKGFKDGITDRVKDIKAFTSDKQNCDFAAATMLNCIVSQTLNSVTPKIAVDISKGIQPVADIAGKVSSSISGPAGAISSAVNKTANEVDRATRLIEKSNIL